jgi:hypothetical protein
VRGIDSVAQMMAANFKFSRQLLTEEKMYTKADDSNSVVRVCEQNEGEKINEYSNVTNDTGNGDIENKIKSNMDFGRLRKNRRIFYRGCC